jgi:hypothetical protein
MECLFTLSFLYFNCGDDFSIDYSFLSLFIKTLGWFINYCNLNLKYSYLTSFIFSNNSTPFYYIYKYELIKKF